METNRFAGDDSNSIVSIKLEDADISQFFGLSTRTVLPTSANDSDQNPCVTQPLSVSSLPEEPSLAVPTYCGIGKTIILPCSRDNDGMGAGTCQKINAQEKLSDFVKQQKWPWLFSSIKNSLGFYPLVLVSIWVLLFAFCGKEQVFPGGTVFNLLLLQVISMVMGELTQITRMPPLLGMLFAGIFVANTNLISITPEFKKLAHPIRALSVGALITRGALCVNTKAINEFRRVVPLLAVIPCAVEAIVASFSAYWILNSYLTPEWCALLGCIICSMSGVILMPLLASLDKSCCGKQSQQVISITRASCGLDAILSICLTNIALGLVYPSQGIFWQDLTNGTLEVALGFVFGMSWGSCIGFLIDPNVSKSQTVASLAAGSALSMIGSARVKLPRCGAPAVFSGTLVSALLWRRKTDNDKHKKYLQENVDKFWWLFQPFLFGVLGAKTELGTVDWNVVIGGVACILISLAARVAVAVSISRCVRLNWRQQLFIAISWIPKGTVQAAVGPLALDMARDYLDHTRGLNVLNITVATILIGGTLGSFALLTFGKPFLKRC